MADREVDAEGRFYGWLPRECGEHRTVGDYRAWCFDCGEWCYSSGIELACKGCELLYLRQRVTDLEARHA